MADNVEVLVVAGGGGGGSTSGGGGGGGGVLTNSAFAVTTGVGVTVTVGAGGAGGAGQLGGANGSNSAFGSITAIGGGGGGGQNNSGPTIQGSGGGSGGGGGGSTLYPVDFVGPVGGGGAGSQGGNGGSGYSDGTSPQGVDAGGGGGGGAGGAGSAAQGNSNGGVGGNGGPGYTSSISGASVIYAGGGGGSSNGSGSGSGGSGGGGSGASSYAAIGGAGAVNTGSGGGGGGINGTGGAGGSGVVIVRYTGVQRGTGGTVSTAGGYTVHKFTSSGTFTLLSAPPVITSQLTKTATQGQATSYTITASNNPTSYGASGLPTGLSVDSAGVISGTPTVAGTVNSTITATNASGPGGATLVWTIVSAAPVITSATTAGGSQGESVTYTITASNAPQSYAATGLPPGLTLGSNGQITGVPTAPGTYTSTITATNTWGSGSTSLVWTILGPKVTLTSTGTGTAVINGNVGIGTSMPNARLQMDGTTDGAQLIIRSPQSTADQMILLKNLWSADNPTAGLAALGWNDTGNQSGTVWLSTLPPGTGGNTGVPVKRLFIDPMGNVGLGTTTPSARLEVAGDTKVTGNLTVQGSFSAPLNANIGFGTTTPQARLHVLGQVNHEVARFQGSTDSSNNRNYMSLYSTNPDYWWEFSVQDENGNGANNGFALRAKHPSASISAPRLFLSPSAQLNGSATPRSYMRLYNHNPDYGWDFSIEDASGNGSLNGFALRELFANQSSAPRLYIATTTGNVGIGTSNPSHKLSVNGTIRAKEVIVNTGWADDVFEAGYRLAPLAEVEAHIQAAGHLPGVPSAQEVADHGVSLGDVQAILLRKVEELTLHAIAMEKQLAAQAAEIQALKAQTQTK